MSLTISEYRPNPPRVGMIVRSIILWPELSVAERAQRLKIGRPALSNVLNGKAALSVELAAKIEDVFRYSAEALLKYQAGWELFTYRREVGGVILPVLREYEKGSVP